MIACEQLLLNALKAPAGAISLPIDHWRQLLPLARRAHVLGRIASELQARGLLEKAPSVVVPHLEAALAEVQQDERITRWELRQIDKALGHLEIPVLLLKGAAYLSAGFAFARGRLCRDVDILVPKEHLPSAERSLLEHGWQAGELSQGNQRYFRSWLHELPPLEHRVRKTLIDVHHSILPPTDTLRIDAAELIRAARPLENSRFLVLSPEDMVIHCAVHLFRNGDFHHGLRDLRDMDGLLRQFSSQDGFWNRLTDRVRRFGLMEPCFFAFTQANLLFETPLPAEARTTIESWAPAWPKAAIVESLVRRALQPAYLSRGELSRELAAWLLAHWPLPRLRAVVSPLFWTKRLGS